MKDVYHVRLASFLPDVVLDTIPGDKSISHRAIIMGALSDNVSFFKHFLFSEDCLCTISIFRALGVSIECDRDQETVLIQGLGLTGLQVPEGVLDVGNSGTAIRLLLGVLAGQSFDTQISGDASIQKRPMGRVTVPLTQMGAFFQGTLDQESLFPPVFVKGGCALFGIDYQMPVASAQVKSSLLLASLYCSGKVTLHQPRLSRDHTERVLAYYGATLNVSGLTLSCVGGQRLSNPNPDKPLFIPGDFSSASFFIVLALIVPHMVLRLNRIGMNATRIALLEHLKAMGAQIQVEAFDDSGIEPYADLIVSSSSLTNVPIQADFIPILIDECPILIVAALFANGRFQLSGARELRVKESDRIEGMVRLIRAIGGVVTELDDGLSFEGPVSFQSFSFDSQGDHRLAMSAIVLAYAAGVEATVTGCECIQTSFPNFFDCLDRCKKG